MFKLHRKMKNLKKSLKTFNMCRYGNIFEKVKEKKRELVELQLLNLSSITDGSIMIERSLTLELHELLVDEESFFKQKSRIRWIQRGDMNIKNFHRMTAVRQKQKGILTLTDVKGKSLRFIQKFLMK